MRKSLQGYEKMATALELTSTDNSWVEFCERHAQAAAQDFSKSCMQFINMNLSENNRSTITDKEFLKKYIDCFTEQFEMDFNKRKLHNTKISNGVSSRSEEDAFENEEVSPKLQHKPFFRR